MDRVLVTGAAGFIGRAVCVALAAQGLNVRAMSRTAEPIGGAAEVVEVPDLARTHRWEPLLCGVRCVVHLASLAQLGVEALARARDINVGSAIRLFEAAAVARVARFVYISSAKVHGEETTAVPFDERSPLAPGDPYAAIKVEAEARLHDVAARSGMELVIVRPPLVYGPGVKANFLALMRVVYRGWPLPFAAIENRRSLMYVGNLASAIACCSESTTAAGRAFLVADGRPVSTPELCRALAMALGRSERLFPFPRSLLELAPPLRKLTRSFEVDDDAIRRDLGWNPPYTFEQGIRATAEWYLREGRGPRG